jgi:hypothetical protein
MADLLRVSILGGLAGGEEWSVNPVWSLGGDFGGVDVTQNQLNTIAAAINGIVVPTGLRIMAMASTTVSGVRIEARTKAGLLEAQTEAGRASVGGQGATPHPFQISACLSLRTATPGPSGRGRMFWPATGALIDSTTLRLTTATLSSFVGGAKTYLTAIDSAIDTVFPTGSTLCVWSRKNASLSAVNLVEAGDVLDVQRRRRDQLIEGKNTVIYP